MTTLKQILSNKLIYVSLAGVLLFGASTILLLDRWIMPAYTNYNEGITVPDVTRLSLEEAQSTLEQYGLRHEVLDRRAHSAYPADFITDQSPAPRQIVKPNRKVYLTVNTVERPTVVVPDLENMSLRNAQIQIENYNLNVGTISYETARFRNTILRQSVAAGDTVDQGTVIDLAVSDGLGDQIVDVPEILGLSLAEAQNKLHQAGLRIGEIRFQPDREAIPNTVLAFSPEEETMREGQQLNLVVSERYDAVEVDEAGAIIDENGVQIQDIDDINDNDDDNDDDGEQGENDDNEIDQSENDRQDDEDMR